MPYIWICRAGQDTDVSGQGFLAGDGILSAKTPAVQGIALISANSKCLFQMDRN